jgi:hypothetical protein
MAGGRSVGADGGALVTRRGRDRPDRQPDCVARCHKSAAAAADRDGVAGTVIARVSRGPRCRLLPATVRTTRDAAHRGSSLMSPFPVVRRRYLQNDAGGRICSARPCGTARRRWSYPHSDGNTASRGRAGSPPVPPHHHQARALSQLLPAGAPDGGMSIIPTAALARLTVGALSIAAAGRRLEPLTALRPAGGGRAPSLPARRGLASGGRTPPALHAPCPGPPPPLPASYRVIL